MLLRTQRNQCPLNYCRVVSVETFSEGHWVTNTHLVAESCALSDAAAPPGIYPVCKAVVAEMPMATLNLTAKD